VLLANELVASIAGPPAFSRAWPRLFVGAFWVCRSRVGLRHSLTFRHRSRFSFCWRRSLVSPHPAWRWIGRVEAMEPIPAKASRLTFLNFASAAASRALPGSHTPVALRCQRIRPFRSDYVPPFAISQQSSGRLPLNKSSRVHLAIGAIAVITAFSGSAKEPKKFNSASSWLLPDDKAHRPDMPSYVQVISHQTWGTSLTLSICFLFQFGDALSTTPKCAAVHSLRKSGRGK